MNKQVNTGPNLDRQKVMQLPDHLGPDRPSVVLQQAVQGCIDSAFQQKAVFTLLTEGYGGEKISGIFTHKHNVHIHIWVYVFYRDFSIDLMVLYIQ